MRRALVEQRNDSTIELVTVLILVGRHAEAYAELMRRRLHPWESGEGRVTSQ
jgi:hypothetical protein